jgi:hypothetical protein
MNRITLRIGRVALRGLHGIDRAGIGEPLRNELQVLLAAPKVRSDLAALGNARVIRSRMPALPATSTKFASSVAQSIVRALKR